MVTAMRALAGIAADSDTMTEALVYFETPEWVALLEWLEFHGIDPKLIPAGTRVSRDECNRCIRYTRIVTGDDGKRLPFPDVRGGWRLVSVPAVEQGEAPPLPYPEVVQVLLRAVHR